MPKKRPIPVWINLMSLIRYEHMPEYPIQLMTQGFLDLTDPACPVLSYTETIPDDSDGSEIIAEVTLRMESGCVTMDRRGEYANTMVFVQGQRYEGMYYTPFGEIPMAIFTRDVQWTVGRDSGSVHLKYRLHIQGNDTSANEIHLAYFTSGHKPLRRRKPPASRPVTSQESPEENGSVPK